MVTYYIRHVYLRPYVYSFCQIFQALRLFPTLRLFRRLEYVLFWFLQVLKTFFKSGGFNAELVSFFTRNSLYLHCIFTITWFKKHYQIHGAQIISSLKWPDWFFLVTLGGHFWLKVFLEFAARSNAPILNNIVFVCI